MQIFSVNAIPGWLYNVDRLYLVKFSFLPIGQRCLKACFLLAVRFFQLYVKFREKWPVQRPVLQMSHHEQAILDTPSLISYG